MNTSNRRIPGRPRVRALIGALAATLALTGAAQVAAPVSASAMKNENGPCYRYFETSQYYEGIGSHYLAEQFIIQYYRCNEILEQH